MSNETQESKMMALEQYKILYQAYADEIKNLWQRSIFLATFMVLVWTGYGVSLLKFLETTKENKLCQSTCTHIEFLKSLCELLASLNVYHFILLALCGIIIILSLLWIAMAKGSKFVQEAHEEHIKRYTKLHHCSIYCQLDKYEKKLNKKLCGDLFFCGTLKAYRYSPSKINIALGWVSLLVGFILLVFHIYLYLRVQNPFLVVAIIDFIKHYILSFYFLSALIFVVLLCLVLHFALKGKTKQQKNNKSKGGKMTA